jgi:hypothetical protein
MNWFHLFGHEDNPVTSFSDLLQQFVTTDPVARLFNGANRRDVPAGTPAAGSTKKRSLA